MSQKQSRIEQAITLLQQSEYVVALTGAGISTPSGIPDFRSANSGVWERFDPIDVASIYTFCNNPKTFFDWIYPLAKKIIEAEPNAAHTALVEMEACGKLKSVITQNIDMLHTRAGSQTVYEVHGHMREATCMHCHTNYDGNKLLKTFIKNKTVPYCDYCDGVLKPNVILFGEMLPVQILNKAQKEAMACDLMLVAGSSLAVSPAGDLPQLAKRTGAKLLFVNLDDTHLDSIADVVIQADVVDVLPTLMASLE
ncbi:MAG: NAD-dependent deacylase [Chloroflexi bacterium]|nr:NAD-dependent deacylase [Chloroflexota bacterium]